MKVNKSLLVAALSLFAASGLMAKQQAKEEVPGVAAQPASYFYTGKPYDADLGAYTFNYRNYDPEVKRWTTMDPSGFPDGANNHVYAAVPTSEVDYQGLFALAGPTSASPLTAANSDNTHKLTVNNLSSIGGINNAELSALQNLYPAWTFNIGSNSLPGTLTINSYRASAFDRNQNSNPTIELAFSFPYQDNIGAPKLRWIQFGVKTYDDVRLEFYPDNRSASQPFYPNTSNPTSFFDNPTLVGWDRRSTWNADTYAALWDGQTTVTIYDGIHWGGAVE